VWLLVAVTLVLAAVEVSTRLFIRRLSRVEHRISTEYAAMLEPPRSSQPFVAMVGNSLLLAALDFPMLQRGVSHRMEARRWVVEGTLYHDWHYGIRKLLGAGAKPRVLLLTMNGKQLISEGSRGDYAAHVMVQRGDILPFVQDLNVHPTNATNLVFGHFSMFYAMRSEIRKFVLGRMIPELPLLFAPAIPAEVPAGELERAARERLVTLRKECERHGVKLMLLIVPSLQDESVRDLQRVAASANVMAFAPFGPGEFPAALFSDGFHLNQDGAARFTERVSDAMLQAEDLTGGR